jgi:hypothetical protein
MSLAFSRTEEGLDIIVVYNCMYLYGLVHRSIGLVHKFMRFLALPNNLFFTQTIKQSINHVFFSITHDCLPTFGQVFNPTLEEIRRFGQ